jgi:hypothetical protein
MTDGYESGFAGKYDRDRALECIEHSDNYNQMWAIGCEDSFCKEECDGLINNLVETEDYEVLKNENDQACYCICKADNITIIPLYHTNDSLSYDVSRCNYHREEWSEYWISYKYIFSSIICWHQQKVR